MKNKLFLLYTLLLTGVGVTTITVDAKRGTKKAGKEKQEVKSHKSCCLFDCCCKKKSEKKSGCGCCKKK